MQGIYLILVLVVIALVLNEITGMNIFQTEAQGDIEIKKIVTISFRMSFNCYQLFFLFSYLLTLNLELKTSVG